MSQEKDPQIEAVNMSAEYENAYLQLDLLLHEAPGSAELAPNYNAATVEDGAQEYGTAPITHKECFLTDTKGNLYELVGLSRGDKSAEELQLRLISPKTSLSPSTRVIKEQIIFTNRPEIKEVVRLVNLVGVGKHKFEFRESLVELDDLQDLMRDLDGAQYVTAEYAAERQASLKKSDEVETRKKRSLKQGFLKLMSKLS